jgi:hypothetical protein
METRTRRVPRYREVKRSRRVPRYRLEPRDEEYFAYKTRSWAPNRTVVASGSVDEPHWPSEDEVRLGQGLEPGEEERAERVETYKVSFRDEDGRVYERSLEDAETFARYPMGSTHELEVWPDGRIKLPTDAPN